MSYATDNAQTACSQILKQHDGEATYADRQLKIRELAEKLMNEFPDYKKSIYKHQQPKITLFGKKISRKELEAEQRRLAAVADMLQKEN